MPSPGSSEAARAPFDLESLARALAEADPRFLVWKGGRDLHAQGDLDAAAPRAAWGVVTEAVEAWARAHGLTAVIPCAHAAGALVLVGCGGAAERRLLQVDVVDVLLVHGAPAWTAADAAAAIDQTDGVLHTLPGAEGVLRRLAYRSDPLAPERIAADPAGADLMVRQLGLRGRLARRAGSAGSLVALEALLACRPVAHPVSLLRALRSDPARKACPVLRALRNDRTAEGELDDWLTEVSRSHAIRRLVAS